MSASKTLIIAEAGVNHNGSIDIAYKLIDAASDAGADMVKFQTFKAENLLTQKASKAEYQRKQNDNTSQFEMIKSLELSKADHEKLVAYCNQKEIEFFSTAFDLDSLDMLNNLGLSAI